MGVTWADPWLETRLDCGSVQQMADLTASVMVCYLGIGRVILLVSVKDPVMVHWIFV